MRKPELNNLIEMKELTLTGGTILDPGSTSDVEMGTIGDGDGGVKKDPLTSAKSPPITQNNAQSAAALELVQQGDASKILQALFGVVRMGPFPVFSQLIQSWKDQVGTREVETHLKEARDAHGHSLLHWAAKRVDAVQFAEALLPYIPVSVTSTSDDTSMTPLHWACTEPNALPVVRLLVNHDRYAVEVADATGCTPLLIAAQHGQVDTVAYLLQHGANLHAVDASRDSATHWAAYKGSRQVLGLLSFYDTRQLTTADTYGQTPLHLAALRGHKSVCKYILAHVGTKDALHLLNQRDRNGRTPHGLAVHKDKHSVAAYLADFHDELTCPKSQKYRRLLQRNVRNLASPAAWKLWLGITVDSSEVDESPLFPYYYVYLHLAINAVFQLWVFWAVGDPSNGVLWDCVPLLVWQALVYGVGVYAFVRTSTTNPGRVDSSFPRLNEWRQLYETTLERYATCTTKSHAELPQLCHTCHIARPLRSKHDRFTDSCILVFDHHCPFVGNSIGLYNYQWFYLFLATTSLFLVQHCVLLFLWWKRQSHPSVLVLVFGIFLGAHVAFAGGMCLYHTRLVGENITTNESMNTHKYQYLWDERGGATSGNGDAQPPLRDSDHQHHGHNHGHNHSHRPSPQSQYHKRFRNPFDHGWGRNFVERLVHPSERSYMLPGAAMEDRHDGQLEALLPLGGRHAPSSSSHDPHAV